MKILSTIDVSWHQFGLWSRLKQAKAWWATNKLKAWYEPKKMKHDLILFAWCEYKKDPKQPK